MRFQPKRRTHPHSNFEPTVGKAIALRSEGPTLKILTLDGERRDRERKRLQKAVEWHVAKGVLPGVSISNGHKTLHDWPNFSWTMASQEIANTVDALRRAAATGP